MNKFYQWSRDAERRFDYSQLYDLLCFMDEHMFYQFQPTKVAGPGFKERLTQWLDGALSESDQKLLFEFTQYLYFVSTQELEALYQEAFAGPIHWWLSDQLGISDLSISSGDEIIADGLRRTWFCSITDSMDIARFYHLHNLNNASNRPNFDVLSHFSTPEIVGSIMIDSGYDRLVLLEDFVGSGNQASASIRFAERISTTLPILVCPLIICPQGFTHIRSTADLTRTTVIPVLELPMDAILTPEPLEDENLIFQDIRGLLTRLHQLVKGDASMPSVTGIYGYRGTGSLAILYTNCPNNVPPVVHSRSDTWKPLFPRSSRI